MIARNDNSPAAEQIVVELRDKVGLVAGEGAEDIISRPGVDTEDEAVEALRRRRILEESNHAFEQLRADREAWNAELAERELWGL